MDINNVPEETSQDSNDNSDDNVNNEDNQNLENIQVKRRRHVAFAPSIDSDNSTNSVNTEVNQYIEDEYYVDGPDNNPILHHINDYHKRYSHIGDDGKLTARKKSMQMIDNYLTEHEGILAMEPGTGLFGPRITVDSKAVRRKIFNQKRPSVFQYMARFHNKLGVRHYVLVALLTIYSALGGLIFLKLEAENEIQSLEKTRHSLINMIEELSEDIFEIANVSVTPSAREDVILLIQDYYREMLKVEGKYVGSVMHKYERINLRLTWSYGSAVFFGMTLFTTIGYGTIACQTVIGKVFSVLYAIIGIPLMLVVLSDVGRVLLRVFTKCYNYSRIVIRRGINYIMKMFLKREYCGMRDEKEFPLYLSILIVIIYLLICSLIITVFDYHDGITPGLSLGDAVYFSFISMATIGLGDVMPNNIEYSPLLAFMFLFGLALLSVVNSTVYERMERKFLHSVDKLENWLENIHFHRHGREGYATFKALGPNMQILALALPIFDDDEEEHIEASLETENTNLGQKLFTRPRARTNSLIEENISVFRPVLGVFSGGGKTRRANTVDCTYTESIPSSIEEEEAIRPTSPVRRVQSDRIPGNQRIIPHQASRLRTISEIV